MGDWGFFILRWGNTIIVLGTGTGDGSFFILVEVKTIIVLGYGGWGFFILVVVFIILLCWERGGINTLLPDGTLYPIHSTLLTISLSIPHLLPRNNGNTSI